MFVVAPVIAVGTATVGFVLANHYDDPPAQMTVALLCLLLAFTWLVRRVRQIGAASEDWRLGSSGRIRETACSWRCSIPPGCVGG